jgi:hypothetical protein
MRKIAIPNLALDLNCCIQNRGRKERRLAPKGVFGGGIFDVEGILG